MSDRHTPETDTNVEDIGMGCQMVSADFARKLERERDEAREKYHQICSQTLFEINKAHEERDETQEKFDALATEHMLAVNKLCNDRDKAIKELELIKEQYGR